MDYGQVEQLIKSINKEVRREQMKEGDYKDPAAAPDMKSEEYQKLKEKLKLEQSHGQ